ncbi:MAG TPA: D-alanine--D-alanine ligase, partial [Candidatus Nitrosocosmicus sp.]|nr:D-alanine--D-alanine ligase [Candidatus Nitrosocosmicus sp.]
MSNKLNLCLLFGGKSGEHEVSLQSAKSIFNALDKTKYEISLIGIDKNGNWLLNQSSEFLLNDTNPKLIALNKSNSIPVATTANNNKTDIINIQTGVKIKTVDVVFPIIHGTYGEDGSLQGLLEIMDIAYVGANVLGSAIGMDKDVMKRLLNYANIPTSKFYVLRNTDNIQEEIKKILQIMELPLFIKPANAGSSVGVSKAHNSDEVLKGIQDAFRYDEKILVEEFIDGREIECSILGNDEPIASIPGEVNPTHEFYSYEAKYIDENGASVSIPAQLNATLVKQIQDLAIKTFKVLECSGMARVDMFLTKEGKLYINEINTLPGFTKISMYPKLWEAS